MLMLNQREEFLRIVSFHWVYLHRTDSTATDYQSSYHAIQTWYQLRTDTRKKKNNDTPLATGSYSEAMNPIYACARAFEVQMCI